MDRLTEALLSVQKAREALRDDDLTEARQWAERAATLAPQMEDPWLLLAAVASPRASVEYIQKALKINPNSPRAQSGMKWALKRLSENPKSVQEGARTTRNQASVRVKSKRSALFPILLFGLGSILCAVAAWTASTSPVLALILPPPALSAASTHPPSWAQVRIAKPSATPTPESLASPTPLMTSTATADIPASLPPNAGAQTDIPSPTEIPSEVPTEAFLPTAQPTWSSSFSMQYVQDTPTIENQSAATMAPASTSSPSDSGTPSNGGERWIEVSLSQQMVYAHEGDAVVNSFLASTGTSQYPTVTGKYHIYIKLRYTDMSGTDYYLPNVPYTMYFYESYGLHGTYWHHNFGTPMSHGCVNLSIPDSEWLYNFASVGTLVDVHN